MSTRNNIFDQVMVIVISRTCLELDQERPRLFIYKKYIYYTVRGTENVSGFQESECRRQVILLIPFV